ARDRPHQLLDLHAALVPRARRALRLASPGGAHRDPPRAPAPPVALAPGAAAGRLAARRRQAAGLPAPPEALAASRDERHGASRLAVRTSTPYAVTSTVCSNWAERARSAVMAVQPSSSTSARNVPALIIGSIVKTIPGSINRV